jgi:hypothetical protein
MSDSLDENMDFMHIIGNVYRIGQNFLHIHLFAKFYPILCQTCSYRTDHVLKFGKISTTSGNLSFGLDQS